MRLIDHHLAYAVALCGAFALTACGGGGNAEETTGSKPASPTLTVSVATKQLNFAWAAVDGATHYRLFENPNGVSGFTQRGGELTGTGTTLTIAVHRHDWPLARYLLEACNGAGCTASNEVGTAGAMADAIGYLKASNVEALDQFGSDVALSGDGHTLAVGAVGEASATADPNDNRAVDAGAVYVFTRDAGGTWREQAYLKASNAGPSDFFGTDVSLSSDGHTLAVGAYGEASVNADPDDDSARNAGAVYVFTRDAGGTWRERAYLKASNAGAGDHFGIFISLSSDGSTLAVGAWGEASGNADPNDDRALNAGAVYIFTRDIGGAWREQAYLKASNAEAGDFFGVAVSLSNDGSTLAVGANGETSANADPDDNSARGAGAVYVFTRDASGTWREQAYLKASNVEPFDFFGIAVALSSAGDTLAVGAAGEASANGDPDDNTARDAGAVYVFTRDAGTWREQAYLKASNAGALDFFGIAVSLSSDGNTLAVGAENEASAGVDPDDNSANNAGAVYVFGRDIGGALREQVYLKSSNPGAEDFFGVVVSLSSDGDTLAVGAWGEASDAAGPDNDNAESAGAVYLY